MLCEHNKNKIQPQVFYCRGLLELLLLRKVGMSKFWKNAGFSVWFAQSGINGLVSTEFFSHASAIKRCLDYKNVSVISFGIRNISKKEVPYLKKNSSRINIFWAKDKKKWNLKKFKKWYNKIK